MSLSQVPQMGPNWTDAGQPNLQQSTENAQKSHKNKPKKSKLNKLIPVKVKSTQTNIQVSLANSVALKPKSITPVFP